MQLKCIGIIGVGLLGGSVALAVRRAELAERIIGIGRRRSSLLKARRLDLIDELSLDPAKAVKQAELIVLATPIGAFEPMLERIAEAAAANRQRARKIIVTDVGSTKRHVVTAAERLLPASIHFVGSHPMAGSEKRGPEFARADLFDGAICFVTPTGRTNRTALRTVRQFWRALGAEVFTLSPAAHDRIMAAISHLPHAVAAVLVDESPEALKLAGPGFFDTTRIASGDPNLWRDIFLSNRDYLLKAIDRFVGKLRRLQRTLSNDDAHELTRQLTTAKHLRDRLVAAKLKRKQLPG